MDTKLLKECSDYIERNIRIKLNLEYNCKVVFSKSLFTKKPINFIVIPIDPSGYKDLKPFIGTPIKKIIKELEEMAVDRNLIPDYVLQRYIDELNKEEYIPSWNKTIKANEGKMYGTQKEYDQLVKIRDTARKQMELLGMSEDNNSESIEK